MNIDDSKLAEDITKDMDAALSRLEERCLSAVILVTHKTSTGLTQFIRRGRGDYYSQLGMAHEFININKAQNIAEAIKRSNEQGDAP